MLHSRSSYLSVSSFTLLSHFPHLSSLPWIPFSLPRGIDIRASERRILWSAAELSVIASPDKRETGNRGSDRPLYHSAPPADALPARRHHYSPLALLQVLGHVDRS